MRKWIPPFLIIVATLVSLFMYARLPEQIPTHWGADGEVNGWSSRLVGTWMIPVMMAAIWMIMRALPNIDPRKKNYESFKGMYEWLIVLTLVFMLALHVIVIASANGARIDMARIGPIAVGAFFVAMGFMLPKARSNWFVGIRTPWTLTSELSWQRTHRLGGVLFVATGVLTLIAALLMPQAAFMVLGVTASLMVVALFVYSYMVWKEDNHHRSAI